MPFDEPGWPRIVEIYPRVFSERVRKSREADRRATLARVDDMPARLCELAGSGPDAFDAAMSAIGMGEHLDQLEALRGPPTDPVDGIEGRIRLPA